MMRTLVFVQVKSPSQENDDVRLCEPLDISHIPRKGEFIWFSEEAHHCSGYGEVVRVDHDFFIVEDIHLIRITTDNYIDDSVEFYLPWSNANKEEGKPSPLWKSVADDFWNNAYPVRIDP
jgi:hypothetical protein